MVHFAKAAEVEEAFKSFTNTTPFLPGAQTDRDEHGRRQHHRHEQPLFAGVHLVVKYCGRLEWKLQEGAEEADLACLSRDLFFGFERHHQICNILLSLAHKFVNCLGLEQYTAGWHLKEAHRYVDWVWPYLAISILMEWIGSEHTERLSGGRNPKLQQSSNIIEQPRNWEVPNKGTRQRNQTVWVFQQNFLPTFESWPFATPEEEKV